MLVVLIGVVAGLGLKGRLTNAPSADYKKNNIVPYGVFKTSSLIKHN